MVVPSPDALGRPAMVDGRRLPTAAVCGLFSPARGRPPVDHSPDKTTSGRPVASPLTLGPD
ncbi:hypothetical protein KPB2_5566 [Klebsiella pneumoniae Kb677]|nr:hypothetical protein KPB2_5566 [Klebsiella pneumoniae Kb677]